MLKTGVFIVLSFMVAMLAASTAMAQLGADQRDPWSPHRDPDMPRNVRETRERMRIDKEKKDYDDMMERGKDIAALAERIERSFTQHGTLSESDLSNIEAVEKSVKKVRSDLGGDDDDQPLDEVLGEKAPSVPEAVESLKTTTANLLEELKKTTRFTISAAAIQSSNAVLKITKFLRFGK